MNRTAQNLDHLLAEVRPENLPGEVETGPPVGNEICWCLDQNRANAAHQSRDRQAAQGGACPN